MLEFYKSATPKARKEYICDLCGQKILKGETYHRYSGKYNGDMFDDKQHLTCRNIINAYCSAIGENEYDDDSISDWLHDKYCFDCKHYDEDDCEHPCVLDCPLIREHFIEKGEKE